MVTFTSSCRKELCNEFVAEMVDMRVHLSPQGWQFEWSEPCRVHAIAPHACTYAIRTAYTYARPGHTIIILAVSLRPFFNFFFLQEFIHTRRPSSINHSKREDDAATRAGYAPYRYVNPASCVCSQERKICRKNNGKAFCVLFTKKKLAHVYPCIWRIFTIMVFQEGNIYFFEKEENIY